MNNAKAKMTKTSTHILKQLDHKAECRKEVDFEGCLLRKVSLVIH